MQNTTRTDHCSPTCWVCVPPIKLGDIGQPQKEIEFEPMPATEPIKEPAAPVPSEPVPA